MPPTFSSSTPCVNGRGGLSLVEKAEVSYRVTAVWEDSGMSEKRGMCVVIFQTSTARMLTKVIRLEVPIIFHPDTDFQSMDGAIITPELWLEMPLNPERSIPFHCAVG